LDASESQKMKDSLMHTKMRSPSVSVVASPHPHNLPGKQRSPVPRSPVEGADESYEHEDEDEGPSDQCQFCGLYDGGFTDDTLDYHFWQDCPMLSDCKYCGQVIEIPCYNDHLLTECEKKGDPRHFIPDERC